MAHILKATPKLTEYRRRINESEEESALSVFTTLELSIKNLEKRCDGADSLELRMLQLSSFLDPFLISERTFVEYCRNSQDTIHFLILDLTAPSMRKDRWDSDLFADTIANIVDINLLDSFHRDSDGMCLFSRHPLVRDWLKARMDQTTHRSIYCTVTTSLGQIISSSSANSEFKIAKIVHKELINHLRALSHDPYLDMNHPRSEVWSTCGMVPEAEISQVWEWFGNYLNSMGQFETAEYFIRASLNSRHHLLGEDHPVTLITACDLATCLAEQGRYKEAEKARDKALKLLQTKIGPRTCQNFGSA